MRNSAINTICENIYFSGSTNSRFGAAVGIPVNFTYKSLEDIKRDEILVCIPGHCKI